MFWLFSRGESKPGKPGRVKPDEVQVFVVDFGGFYRVDFNFGGNFYTSVSKVVVADGELSRLPGFKGVTAGEAYRIRKERNEAQRGGDGFGSLVIRETERITTSRQVKQAVDDVLGREAERGAEWVRVSRYNFTVSEFKQFQRSRWY